MSKQVAIIRPPTQSIYVYVLSSHFSRRLACGHTSRGHTGGRSRRISPPPLYGAYLSFNATRLQPRLCTKSDFV